MATDVTFDRTVPAQNVVTAVDPTPSAVMTLRDRIRKAIDDQVKLTPIELNVPSTPGMTIVYSHEITGDHLIDYAKRSGIDLEDLRNAPGNEQNVRSAAMALAEHAEIIKFDGDVWNDEGSPVTFKRQAMHDMMGTDDWVECVRRLYAVDGDIVATSQLIFKNAGLTGDRVGPTRGR